MSLCPVVEDEFVPQRTAMAVTLVREPVPTEEVPQLVQNVLAFEKAQSFAEMSPGPKLI
jgi:hypothetical protein